MLKNKKYSTSRSNRSKSVKVSFSLVVKELAMKRFVFQTVFAVIVCVSIQSLSAENTAPTSCEGNLYKALFFKKWLTDQTVNFENLRYTDVHVLFVFWSQGTVSADEEPGAVCAPPRVDTRQ